LQAVLVETLVSFVGQIQRCVQFGLTGQGDTQPVQAA
jgi:hypothetical protein